MILSHMYGMGLISSLIPINISNIIENDEGQIMAEQLQWYLRDSIYNIKLKYTFKSVTP